MSVAEWFGDWMIGSCKSGVSPMMNAGKLLTYARLALELRGYLRAPMTPDQARRIIATGLAERQARFLALLRDRAYGQPASPYLALLRHAGLAFQDVAALVQGEGVEGTLARLAQAGVYISLAEFKGRQPIRRGSLEVAIKPGAFNAPRVRGGLEVRSGATRGAGTPTLIGIDLLVEETAHRGFVLQMAGHDQSPAAVWQPILPGSAGIKNILRHAKLGRPPERWFSHAPVQLSATDQAAWMTSAILRVGRFYGSPLPMPEHVPLSDAWRVAEWVVEQRRRHGRCQVTTYVSSALRVCATAAEAGHRLDGVLFRVGGEPLSPTRAAAIRATGADVIAAYSMSEAGSLGYSCADPRAPDDMHLLLDRVALIQQPREVDGRAIPAFLLTALSPHAPRTMLNVETGDTGQLRQRACGCPYHALGFDRHVDSVVSYEKLTGEGMTYHAADLARVIEEVLPARFGGDVTAYQALEEEGEDGLTHVTLLVSPRLGELDETAIIATVRGALRRGPAGYRLAELIWGQTDFLRVRRAEPVLTPRGKLLPFHARRPT